MKINSSATPLGRRLADHIDQYDAAPKLKLKPIDRAGEADLMGEKLFSFEVEGHKPLSHQLDEEWKKNIHSRKLEFALRKLLNDQGSEINRLKQRFQSIGAAASSSQANTSDLLKGLTLDAISTLATDIESLLRDVPADGPLPQICQNILQRIDSLRIAFISASLAKDEFLVGEDDQHHSGGGAIVVDVDEAIHGLYAAINYAVQAMKSGGKEVAKQFSEEAHLLGHSPLEWVKDQGAPHGGADLGLAMGLGVLLVPFSLLAMKAGVEEIQSARQEKKRLNKLKGRLKKRLDHLPASPASALQSPAKIKNPLNMQRLQINQGLDDLELSFQQNKEGGAIGAFSFSSGATIATKVVLDMVSKATHVATSGAAGPLAATAASGMVGTFALGPLAAVSALGLGAYMVDKSATKAKAFAKEKNHTMEAISEALSKDSSERVKDYADFLHQKLDQHERFYNNYRDWNKGFLAGSGIYTMGTLAKVGVVVAASAGAVAIAEPVTLATVIALGALGGAIMGASSHQFLSGHGRHHRYEHYFKDDDLELDRHFVAAADLLCLNDDLSNALTGLELRASFHQQIYQREEERQDLLHKVATVTGKRFSGLYTYTADNEATRIKRGEKPSKSQLIKTQLNQRKEDAQARLLSARAFGSKLIGGSFNAAIEESHKTWNENRTVLSKTHLAAWLNHENNDKEINEHMKTMLGHQLATLEPRMELKIRTYAAVMARSADFDNFQAELENGRKLREVLIDLDKDMDKDSVFYGQLIETRGSLENPDQDDEEKSLQITRFVSLQLGKCFDASAQSVGLVQARRALAKYLLEDAPTRYRDLRGKLLEAELEAGRLRKRYHTIMTGESSSAHSAGENPVGALS